MHVHGSDNDPNSFFAVCSSRPQATTEALCRRAPSRSRSWLRMTRARCGQQVALHDCALVLNARADSYGSLRCAECIPKWLEDVAYGRDRGRLPL